MLFEQQINILHIKTVFIGGQIMLRHSDIAAAFRESVLRNPKGSPRCCARARESRWPPPGND
ncbi:TPA: hypothetical protein MHT75_15880 [Klebsiella pneumoniae]|nr:hypothetical protein [Klebsiella pneumoniae]HBX2813601.1 hypothetical protein [Klebsiella pneumoniae]